MSGAGRGVQPADRPRASSTADSALAAHSTRSAKQNQVAIPATVETLPTVYRHAALELHSGSLAPPTYTLKREELVGNWIVDKQLGIGGQAEVWKVRHATEVHTPPAALKLLRPTDQKSRTRFNREVNLLRANVNSGIVAVRDSNEYRGRPFFVMELANASLERLAQNDIGGVRVLHEAPVLLLNFFKQACAAVGHLHANNVVLRDIKPSNILLMLDGPDPMRAVLCDLGIAATIDGQRSITSTQEAVGTPIYRAPEAVFGEHTVRSDLYSLGKTLEFMFTRVHPSQQGPGRCPRDARLSSEAWDAIDRVIATACDVLPTNRYQHANELVAALPALLLTCVAPSSPAAPARNATAVSLSADEARTLATVISGCPTAREAVSVYWVAQTQKRNLSDYDCSIAIRRLESIGFVEAFEDTDFRGEVFSALRPTEIGIRWAIEHPEHMKSSDLDTQGAPGTDDDIPF
jgi:serine/threonine protein kinase